MTLTRFSDYSLRVLIFAALRGERPFSVDEVSRAYGLSRHHVAKVVNSLVRGGSLRARRGRRGGVWLGVPAESIRLGLLLRQTEGAPGLVECLGPAPGGCRLTPACRLKSALAVALEAFYASLNQHTLRDLVENRTALAGLLGQPS